jgi:hypothetical protein
MQHFERALQLRPDYAEVHYNLARTLLQAGSLTGHRTFQQAVRLNCRPNTTTSWRWRWCGHVGARGYRTVPTGLRLNPNLPKENNLGSVLSEAGRPQEATSISSAVRPQPDFPDAHSNPGRVPQLGRLDEGLSISSGRFDAIPIPPSHTTTWVSR